MDILVNEIELFRLLKFVKYVNFYEEIKKKCFFVKEVDKKVKLGFNPFLRWNKNDWVKGISLPCLLMKSA